MPAATAAAAMTQMPRPSSCDPALRVTIAALTRYAPYRQHMRGLACGADICRRFSPSSTAEMRQPARVASTVAAARISASR
jgi:hypothetical protein